MSENNRTDISGERFGRLLAIEESGRNKIDRSIMWECLCDCGNTKRVRSYNLISGSTKSCGCLRRELTIERGRKSKTTHNLSRTPEYGVWRDMKQRCLNPNNKWYHRYGGRGISVCERWMKSFVYFYEDMGKRPGKEYSIERIDNDGNYEPTNCKWATDKEQGNNTCSTNVTYPYNGESLTRADVIERFGISHSTFHK